MKVIWYAFVFLMLINQLSCKKKESDSISPTTRTTSDTSGTVTAKVIDTIKPLSYYPMYPGSYWTYLVNDSTTETDYASLTYQKDSYMTDNYPPVKYSDTVYIPFFQGQAIYRYSHILIDPLEQIGRNTPFLSETVGDKFPGRLIDPRHQNVYEWDDLRVIEKKQKGTDSVITTQREVAYESSSFPIYPVITFYYTEYTKGIGVTKYCIIDGATLDTTYKKVLTNYSIHH